MDKYKNREDFWKMLAKLKPINLLSPETTKKEAFEFCANVMRIFAKYNLDELGFNHDDFVDICELLIDKGCISFINYSKLQEKHPEFFPSDKKYIDDPIKEPNDLSFPISAMANVIKNKEMAAGMCFGPNDWCDQWLKSYEKFIEENETL